MQRYTLNLSNIFPDHRQKVFVGRRKDWQLISCLQDYVRSSFRLQGEVYLTNEDGILFPESEGLELILGTDQLVVHISNETTDTQSINAPVLNGKRKLKSFDDEDNLSEVFTRPQSMSKNYVEELTKPKTNGIQKLNSDKKTEKVENTSNDIKTISASALEKNDLPRDSKQNGKRKFEPSHSSDSESDGEKLPQIFVGLESMTKNDDIEEPVKPKRKRIRKRKLKKKDEEVTPKVVVKTYDEEDKREQKEEPYTNLNKNTVPRIVKAVVQTTAPVWNQEVPTIPDYEDVPAIELDEVVTAIQPQKRQRQRKKSVEIKQETIDFKLKREASPTWDAEVDQAREKFISNYCGNDVWNSLRDVLGNFPAITIPSESDIIAYRYSGEAYLAFVERADDGENDASPALKLTLRRLNAANSKIMTVGLDQLSDVRLIATYQP
ncbi:uncharacterized protein LOC131679181 isoform X2 [Topomyia yanbarensis]|uniref:uncharacterized protein LOC131679181 isoform X2 n=1 Tax=Topomyia yanbarensis TaxID=2498891 RepID=UPI00273C929D|nr:uncharacterized protein LOC131679181 isoform X2 [Topomyia yanbarensis]